MQRRRSTGVRMDVEFLAHADHVAAQSIPLPQIPYRNPMPAGNGPQHVSIPHAIHRHFGFKCDLGRTVRF